MTHVDIKIRTFLENVPFIEDLFLRNGFTEVFLTENLLKTPNGTIHIETPFGTNRPEEIKLAVIDLKRKRPDVQILDNELSNYINGPMLKL